MPLKICVLGSGSSGNCTLVQAGDTAILIDAGLSGSETLKRLASAGLTPSAIAAVCLTHEHSDHTSGLKVLHQRHGISLYANAGTIEALEAGGKIEGVHWNIFQTGQDFTIGNMQISPFSVSHDSYDPVGFTITTGTANAAIVTDMGTPTTLVKERLKGCSIIVIESNHDEALLKSSKRPWHLKQRIMGRQGHLANTQTAELLVEVASPLLQHVVLAHLSSECNTPELATTLISAKLKQAGFTNIQITVAAPNAPTPLLS